MEKMPNFEKKEEQPMNVYEMTPSQHIDKTVERMIALAKETKGEVRTKFNGIELVATEDSIFENMIEDFKIKMEESRKEYRESPEGQRLKRESEERKQESQQKADALMEELPSLDFNNQEAVLNWICEFQEPSDHIGVITDNEKVLKIFSENGYQPNVNVGEAFNGEDRDNFARYIVGQALDGLQGNVGAINQIVHKFTDDWKKKFPS